MAKKAFVVRPEDVPTYAPAAAHKGTLNRRLVGRETVGARNVEVIIGEVAPAGMGEPHYHDPEEQAMYLLEGKCLVEVEGESREMRPGDIAFFAAGRRHKVIPVGGPMKVLVIYSPPLVEGAAAFKT